MVDSWDGLGTILVYRYVKSIIPIARQGDAIVGARCHGDILALDGDYTDPRRARFGDLGRRSGLRCGDQLRRFVVILPLEMPVTSLGSDNAWQ